MGTRRRGGEGKEPASKRNRVRFNALIIKHPEGKKNAVKRSTLRGQSGVTNQQNSLRPFRLVLFLSLSLFSFPFFLDPIPTRHNKRFRQEICKAKRRRFAAPLHPLFPTTHDPCPRVVYPSPASDLHPAWIYARYICFKVPDSRASPYPPFPPHCLVCPPVLFPPPPPPPPLPSPPPRSRRRLVYL